MIELVGRENGAFRDTKVLENVSVQVQRLCLGGLVDKVCFC